MQKYTTFDGSTVEVQSRGYQVDLHVKNPKGETIATVQMSRADAADMVSKLVGVQWA